MRIVDAATLPLVLALAAAANMPTIAHAQATPDRVAKQPATRPDIILFVADDLTRRDLRAYGGLDARTPNIDEMEREGLRFTNAFAASPSCSPSRTSLYSGNFPMRHGAHSNHSPIRRGMATMPRYLAKLGYRVVIAGKTHIGAREDFPFEYMPGSVTRPAGGGALSSNLDMAAIDTLLATRDPRRPLALIVNSFAPHVPWPINEGYDPQRLTMNRNLVDTPPTREAMARYLTRVSQADRDLGALRASIARSGRTDDTLLMFTADQGAQFPFGKWTLYDAGIATPLIAVWPGRIAPGRTSDAIVSLVDILPTLQEAAGGKTARTIDGCSFLPLLAGGTKGCRDATFAAHSGVPDTGPDANIAPMRAIRTDRYKLIVNFRTGIRYVSPVSTARGRDAYFPSWVRRAETDPKATAIVARFHHRAPIELYDIRADPDELTNLATDPTHAARVAELRARLT